MFKKLLLTLMIISVIFSTGCKGTKQIDKASLVETVTVDKENGQIYYTFYLISGKDTPYSISVPALNFEQACNFAKNSYIPNLTLEKLELLAVNENIYDTVLEKDVKFMSEQWYFSPTAYVTLCDDETLKLFSNDKEISEIIGEHIIQLKNKKSNLSINTLSIFNNFSDNKVKKFDVSYINSQKELKSDSYKIKDEK